MVDPAAANPEVAIHLKAWNGSIECPHCGGRATAFIREGEVDELLRQETGESAVAVSEIRLHCSRGHTWPVAEVTVDGVRELPPTGLADGHLTKEDVEAADRGIRRAGRYGRLTEDTDR